MAAASPRCTGVIHTLIIIKTTRNSSIILPLLSINRIQQGNKVDFFFFTIAYSNIVEHMKGYAEVCFGVSGFRLAWLFEKAPEREERGPYVFFSPPLSHV